MDLGFDLHAAARSLRRRPGFSLTVAGTLALALGVLTATLAVVYGVLLSPLPYRAPEQLVLACEVHPSVRDFCVGSPANAADWQRETRTLASLGLARDWPFTLQHEGAQRSVLGGLATDGAFRVLELRPALGRTLRTEDLGPSSHVVVLSHAFWRTAFAGDSSIVGRGIVLDDSTWTVVGVLEPGALVPTLETVQLWAPLPFRMDDPDQRGWRGFSVFARLRDGVHRAQAEGELRGFARELARTHPETNAGWDVELRPLRDQVVGRARPLLLVFLTATSLVLLVAAANIANLMLARSSARMRELAVRAAVGGGRARLVRSLLLESLLLATLGTGLAMLVARAALGAFLRVAPAGLPRLEHIGLGPGLLLVATLLGALVAFLAGLAPVIRASHLDLSTALRSTGADAGFAGRQRSRSALVVSQIAMAVTLLTGAGLLTRTFLKLLSWQPGFETGHVMVAWTSVSPGRYPEGRQVAALQREVRANVASVAGVIGVGNVSNGPLFGGSETGSFRAHDGGGIGPMAARWYDASAGYVEALGLMVSRGRSFSPTDAVGAPPVAVVNETFARRMWRGEDPVGQQVSRDEPNAPVLTVVGVLRDVPPFRTGEPVTPEIWWVYDQSPRWGAYLVVRTRVPPETITSMVQDRIAQVAPALQLGQFHPVRELIQRQLATPRFGLILVSGFAGLALLMAVVGLYGLVSYLVSLRTRELAIRMALGASRTAVRGEVMRRGLVLVSAGAGLGFLGTLVMSRVLRALLAGVSPFDPPTFIAVALVLISCAALATWAPARRASQADPMSVLRSE